MTLTPEFAAKGIVSAVRDGLVTFQPRACSYELHLRTAEPYTGPINSLIECYIRLSARKVYTVPSGGNFIQPIFGTPKIVQGRVRYADPRTVVVQATVPIICDLPAAESAIDLSEGGIRVGHMVNVVSLPGATFLRAEVGALSS